MIEVQYAIETKGLKKNYGNVQALKSLDLKVKKNSIYGFIGPNGAGKTTTIKLLLGLLKPTAGEGTMLGLNIRENSVDIRRSTGYLTQKPSYYPKMTAIEILKFCAGFYFKGPENLIMAKISELLELVELQDKCNRAVGGFSGGEIQRLGIAQALIHSPELIILDEPAASLDPLGRHKVLDTLEKLRGLTTIFYSTHILSDVERVSDTVGVLHNGELIAQASIDEIMGGTDDSIYRIEYDAENEIDFNSLLIGLDWVTQIQNRKFGEHYLSLVSVSNQEIADKSLLRKILNNQEINVLKFERKTINLEGSFIELIKKSDIKGDKNVK